jgi:hypothetical protein
VKPRLGRLPVKSDVRALQFANFADVPKALPVATNFWKKRAPFQNRTFGNIDFNNCTRAKQAIAHLRMERIECRATPKISNEEVIRVFREMCVELYGGADVGAYETDALSAWRKPEKTFRDTKGRPLTIDAYTRIDPFDHEQVKAAIFMAGAHGIAVCVNLPAAFAAIEPPADWAVPDGVQFVGKWMPGSWGGHSMWATDYDATGVWVEHTWDLPRQRITWKAAAAYLDEAHLCIDSWNSWRKKPGIDRALDMQGIKKAVNAVSATKIV